MTALHLSGNFVMQSSRPEQARSLSSTAALDDIRVSEVLQHERTIVALLEASAYPCTGSIRVQGLAPDRHYRVRGLAHSWCRTDSAGEALIAARLDCRTLVAIEPVV